MEYTHRHSELSEVLEDDGGITEAAEEKMLARSSAMYCFGADGEITKEEKRGLLRLLTAAEGQSV